MIGATREEAGWDPSLTAGGVAWLLHRAMEVVPAPKDCPIAEMWTGFRPSSADGLPIIGRGEFDGLYFLTGHGPSGIAPLPGSIALLMALVAGEAPPLAPGMSASSGSIQNLEATTRNAPMPAALTWIHIVRDMSDDMLST